MSMTKENRGKTLQLTTRRLSEADARAYRGLLVEALIVYPKRFTADYRVEATRPLCEIEQRLGAEFVWGAWRNGELCGIVSFVEVHSPKCRQLGLIRDFYVREQSRHAGLAQQLIRDILRQAAQKVDQVELLTANSNYSAIRFYEGCGFRKLAVLTRGLRIEGRDHDLQMLIQDLR